MFLVLAILMTLKYLKSVSTNILWILFFEVLTALQQQTTLNFIWPFFLDPSRGKPFYFGTTRLFCMAKGKRGSSPSRPTWALKHRWIEYNGHFFERLKNGGDIFSSDAPKDSNKCSSSRESRPAGYSSLSIDCMKRCTTKYRQRYGGYRLLSNNCHHFANRFSDILCSSSTCPSWCAWIEMILSSIIKCYFLLSLFIHLFYYAWLYNGIQKIIRSCKIANETTLSPLNIWQQKLATL